MSSKDGRVLHQAGGPNSNTADFISYAANAAEQIEIAIGVTGRQYSIFTLEDDSKLLVFCGQDVNVGIKVSSGASPEPIADGLRPALSRIRLHT